MPVFAWENTVPGLNQLMNIDVSLASLRRKKSNTVDEQMAHRAGFFLKAFYQQKFAKSTTITLLGLNQII